VRHLGRQGDAPNDEHKGDALIGHHHRFCEKGALDTIERTTEEDARSVTEAHVMSRLPRWTTSRSATALVATCRSSVGSGSK
jgi:hypothetical protein